MTVIERHRIVDAPPERVWARVVTPVGINDELRPWMTMSMPRGKESLTVDNIPVGTPVGRCWMRLFGVLPFDYDDLMIAELWPGRRGRNRRIVRPPAAATTASLRPKLNSLGCPAVAPCGPRLAAC